MKIVRTIKEIKEEISSHRLKGRTIGFVPTMGALHSGHLSLVEPCKRENDVTVVSVFVNPAQFGPTEDFDRYPRDFQKDESMLREAGVDLVFYPDTIEIYPPGFSLYIDVGNFGSVLCGKSRPTHFRGVATVVLKLFNIVKPDNAYFGQKDAQQALLLKRMAVDFNLDVTVKAMPIIRDEDGLALSSRNVYLSVEEREAALAFPRALRKAYERIQSGLRVVAQVKDVIREEINKSSLVSIDYIEIVRLDTLEAFPESPEGRIINMSNTLVAGAVWVGKTRLIDNFILGEI